MRAPRVRIEPLAVTRSAQGRWKVRWRITNDGDPLHLVAIVAPSGTFRSRDHAIDVALAAGGTFEPQLEITSGEPAGTEVEDAILAITAENEAGPWRIAARMRVRVGADGVPHPATERIEVQRAG